VTGSFREVLETLAGQVDRALDDLLPAATGPLEEAMRYSVFAGGKRVRPVLCLLVAQVEGDPDGSALTRALPAAAALEMIHTYSLIHDDLPCMDDDDLRRGRPTCHRIHGEALAVLAGDALNTVAFGTLAEHYPGAPGARLVAELARSAGPGGMVGGQVEDLQAMHQPPDQERLFRIHERKTAALFRASTAMGALCVETTASRVEGWRALGQQAGLAFQIADDILDVVATTADMGKATGKDAAAGKMTYPGLLGVAESRRLMCEHLRMARVELEGMKAAGGPIQAFLDYLEIRTS